jgi:predicted GNAT superfamily acetyltransferase
VRAATGTSDPHAVTGQVVLRPGAAEEPVVAAPDGDVLLAWVPPSIVRIRDEDPERAGAWRRALRETVGHALAHDFRAEAMTRDGWLVLTR